MRVALFDLHGHRIALKLDRIETILPPSGERPAGREIVDLAPRIGATGEEGRPDASGDPLVLLAGRNVALRAGAAIATLAIEPSWILPIPPYLFAGGAGAFAGLVQVPQGTAARRSGGTPVFLLVDDDRLFAGGTGA